VVWSALVCLHPKSLTHAVSALSVSWQTWQDRTTTYRYFILKSDTKANICKKAFLDQWKPSRAASEVNVPLFVHKVFLQGKVPKKH
jgi:hypothetical protein